MYYYADKSGSKRLILISYIKAITIMQCHSCIHNLSTKILLQSINSLIESAVIIFAYKTVYFSNTQQSLDLGHLYCQHDELLVDCHYNLMHLCPETNNF